MTEQQINQYKLYYYLVNQYRKETDSKTKKELYKEMSIAVLLIRELYKFQMASYDYSYEAWRDIKGYENMYQVSNFGRIKSLKRKAVTSDRIWIGTLHMLGYIRFKLRKNGIAENYPVHQLEANAFLKPVNGKNQVNHINSIKSDNRLLNFEWCTNGENQIHSFVKGGRVIVNKTKGEDCSYSKLTTDQVIEIKKGLCKGMSGAELSRRYSVSQQTISGIKFNRNWKHISI